MRIGGQLLWPTGLQYEVSRAGCRTIALEVVMQGIIHWFNYYLLKPIVSRLPTAVWAFLCRLLALPVGLLQLIHSGGRQRRYLDLLGLPSGFLAIIRFSIASAHEKLRRLDFYLYSGVPHLVTEWEDIRPTTPTMFVTLNTYGMETLGAWTDLNPGVVIRRQWDGEDDADPSKVEPTDKWRIHQAAMRRKIAGHREILVGANPLSYRKVRGVKQHLLIYQDVWEEQASALTDATKSARPTHQFFGKPTPLPLGGLRLTKMAGGLPMRLLTFEPKGGQWIGRASSVFATDAQTLIARMEAEIRRRPAAWMLWPDWLEYQERHAARSESVPTEAPGLLADSPEAELV